MRKMSFFICAIVSPTSNSLNQFAELVARRIVHDFRFQVRFGKFQNK